MYQENKNKFFFSSIIVLVLFAILLACQQNNSQKVQVVKLGAILPMTGTAAFLGQQELVGLQLGIEDANQRLSAKGYKIELIMQDSASKPANAVTIANKMITVDKVDVLFVSTSSANQAVAPIAKLANLPMFVMASDVGLTKGYENMFRIFMNFDTESQTLVKYITDMKYRKIGIIHASLKAFESQLSLIKQYLPKNVSILEIQNYELGNKDCRTQIEKLSRKDIEALVVLGQGPELNALVSQIKENKILSSIPIVGGFTFLSDSAKVGGVAIYDKLVFASFAFTADSPELIKFRDRKSPDGKALTDFIDYAYTYDNIVLLATALENKKPGQTLLSSLQNIKTIKGITGSIEFDNNRDSLIQMRMATYKNGKVSLLDNI